MIEQNEADQDSVNIQIIIIKINKNILKIFTISFHIKHKFIQYIKKSINISKQLNKNFYIRKLINN